jgi:hypothetical protein
MERAYLYVDGNAACAVLGQNIQVGECEFVRVNPSEADGERAACLRAYERLKARLPGRRFGFVFGAPGRI